MNDPQPSPPALQDQLRELADAEAVRELMSRYHRACDGWDERGTHRDPEAIADLFTDDGVWDVTSRDPSPAGRGEIIQLARDLQAVPWIVHVAVNPIIEIDGDTATGYFKGILRVKPQADSRRTWSIGIYELFAARERGEWKIQRLSWTAVEPPVRFDPART